MEKDLKLLMAEDNEINRKLASMVFKRQNLSLDLVSNGQEDLDAVQKQRYDLVFMDIEMPVMGGIDATHKINATLGADAPPIVALTAHTMDGDRERFMAEGMKGYLTKPINTQELNELIETLVS